MDALLLTIYAQTIAVNNTKVGLFGDQRYIVLGFFSAVVFLLFHFLSYQSHKSVSRWGKFITLVIFILVTIVGVGNSYMALREKSGTNRGMSDAGVQTEISGKLLLLGKNPYTADYFKTDLVNVAYQDAQNNTINPALYYYVYPPMVPIVTAVAYKIIAPRLHWFDIRVVYISFMLALLAIGYFKWGLSDTYFLYLIGVGLNPDFVRTMLEGANDIIAIAFFIAGVLVLNKRKYWIIAAILYALSIGTKQIIWSSVPFVALAVWKQYGFKFASGFMAVAGAFSLLIFMPFAVWNYQMLMNGLIGFHAGTIPHSYPIHNFGFGKLLVQLGVVKNIYTYYNFMLWQLGGIAVLGFVIWKIFKSLNMQSLIMVGWTGSMMILFLFNRAMNFSYLGIMQVAVAMTVCFLMSDNTVKAKLTGKKSNR